VISIAATEGFAKNCMTLPTSASSDILLPP
jgi:hypothetical protein